MAIKTFKTNSGGVRYQATVWSGNKPVKSKTFTRKIDAKEWEQRQKIQLVDNRVGRLKGDKMTLGAFFDQVYWITKDIRPGTAQDYERIYKKRISPAFGHRRISEIGADEWSQFKCNLVSEGTSKARANRIHAVASAIYKVAVKKGYALANPMHKVDWFEEDLQDFDYWQFDESEQFLNWAYFLNHSRFVFYQLVYETGLRVSEIQALQRDCVDLVHGIITIRRAYCKKSKKVAQTTKGANKRRLGINPSLVSALQKHLASHASEFVFCNKAGRMNSYIAIADQFRKDQALAEVRRIGFHEIRHTYASHYVMRGGNIYDLKDLMGHSAIETTMRYAHLSPGHLKAKSALVSFTPASTGNVVELKPAPKYYPSIEPTKESATLEFEILESEQVARRIQEN